MTRWRRPLVRAYKELHISIQNGMTMISFTSSTISWLRPKPVRVTGSTTRILFRNYLHVKRVSLSINLSNKITLSSLGTWKRNSLALLNLKSWLIQIVLSNNNGGRGTETLCRRFLKGFKPLKLSNVKDFVRFRSTSYSR